jgi:hypothetical protein
MSGDVLALLTGPSLRIRDRAELEEFVERPGAGDLVASSSFEQVFFTIKAVGFADSIGLLRFVTESQVRGFIDLDCWRKDSFVRRPFMRWIAVFVQAGPEETVRALRGIDEDVTALFLKDLIDVYEIERDEPPPATELTYTPDGMLAVSQRESGDEASIAGLILDALFGHDPGLGLQVLRRVRYRTRAELEENAYQSKVRRLDVHGFVDYYEALSIYAEPGQRETFARPPAGRSAGIVPGDAIPQFLPTVFADSLSEGGFLMAALGGAKASDTERLADELTALGNRILSANLVNMGEVGGIRQALTEMKDFLTIGLERLSEGDVGKASVALGANHAQVVFRVGFSEVAALRTEAEGVIRIPGFRPELLESPDVEFLSGLVRFKPLLWSGERFRNIRSLAEIDSARSRIGDLAVMVEGFLSLLGEVRPTLRRSFNTAVVRKATTGRFEARALRASELEAFMTSGAQFPDLDIPEPLLAIAERWLSGLRLELELLAGRRIDPRFVDSLHLEL